MLQISAECSEAIANQILAFHGRSFAKTYSMVRSSYSYISVSAAVTTDGRAASTFSVDVRGRVSNASALGTGLLPSGAIRAATRRQFDLALQFCKALEDAPGSTGRRKYRLAR
jgi:hypothetical protein